MSVIVLKPNRATATYNEAANVFADMYKKVTGNNISICEKDDGVSDLVVIGSDSVNDFLMSEILELNIDSLGIRYGTDDYCIRFCKKDNRNILILAGGRGRSTLYAIYGYFEKYLNCHYFWDGDVVPHNDGIPMQGVDIVESPRFQYRGLRYFAHRGLKRFQAEHWSFEDWKIEIDWMVKKRLNFFMLRIGMDDVWQRAFPEAVPYPDGYLKIDGVDAEGYNDRSDFWTLKYRGELREKILEYARLLDLTYPTDCGTMTHWYSRTPISYLENKKPKFANQASSLYISSDTGKVWDFTDKNEMDNYMKLTETMVNEYEKSTELFHTIGLGERWLFYDKKKNHTSKLIAYRRIAENIRERYPNSKLMVASWDFLGWWTGDEVQKLISELDPERTIILDYTSDFANPEESFPNWGVAGKFPWIFGLFHAYASESELRGNYDLSDERLKIAMNDKYCKGMILWPELSHSDPLVLEYLTQNAWSPLERNIEEITENFCKNRYGKYSDKMNECWQGVLPFIKKRDWSGYIDVWTNLTLVLHRNAHVKLTTENDRENLESTLPLTDKTVNALKKLAMSGVDFANEFILRDVVDITRTVLGRFLNFIITKVQEDYSNKALIRTLKGHYMELLEIMADVLSLNNDFSLYKTLKYIESVAPVNPDFEITLKRNIYNFYCSQMAYELVEYIFKDECNMVFDKLITSDCAEIPDFSEEMKVIIDKFMNTPLKEMQRMEKTNPDEVILKAAEAVEAACKILQTK